MCGIAGVLDLSGRRPVALDELQTMAAQLRHRGPDADGFHLDGKGRCGLAFRRLAIIDLDTGNQPLSNEAGDVWSVFNGEIYNYRALREQLALQGHRLHTRGDGETIAHLYEDHGQALFEKLAGMFAIAVWDASHGRLLLARDRLGKKPLVYAVHDERVYFASEAKAILALGRIPRQIDAQSLHRYLMFQYVPAPYSIFRGLYKVEPGSLVCFEAGGGATPLARRYWRIPEPLDESCAQPRGCYAAAKARLGELLTRAVQRRLLSDVPLGAFLSGGVDSSVVVGLMRGLGVSPLRTFSIGFTERRYDETHYARLVARRFETEHVEHVVTPQAQDILDLLAFHYDEPMADASAIPTYYVSQYTRQHVTVALTGDGGDECFGGYDRYRAMQLADCADLMPRFALRGLGQAAHLLPHGDAKTLSHRAYRFLGELAKPPSERYLSWMNIFTPAQLAAGYTAAFRAGLDFDEPLRWFEQRFSRVRGSSRQRANDFDLQSYLPDDLLVKVDIASMACGLECRAPLLDHELVEFAARLPAAWKFGAAGGKRILKDWARDLLPPEILRRPKMGFGVPLGAWFRGELRTLLTDALTASDSLCVQIFDRAFVSRLLDEHQSERANHAHRLWALLTLEFWKQRWQPQLA